MRQSEKAWVRNWTCVWESEYQGCRYSNLDHRSWLVSNFTLDLSKFQQNFLQWVLQLPGSSLASGNGRLQGTVVLLSCLVSLNKKHVNTVHLDTHQSCCHCRGSAGQESVVLCCCCLTPGFTLSCLVVKVCHSDQSNLALVERRGETRSPPPASVSQHGSWPVPAREVQSLHQSSRVCKYVRTQLFKYPLLAEFKVLPAAVEHGTCWGGGRGKL